MTDQLTTEIRCALAELVDAAPLPPALPWDGGRSLRRPRPTRVAAISLLAAALAGGVFAVDHRHPSTSVAVGQPPNTRRNAEPAPIGSDALPPPTFVSPASLPGALHFIEGGSSSPATSAPNEILIAGAEGRSARLLWTPGGACGNASPVTTVRPNTGGSDPPSPVVTAVASDPESAAYVSTGANGSLHWCEGGTTNIMVLTNGFDESAARALAATVRPAAGRADDLTLVPPIGFSAGRPNARGVSYTLAFRPSQSAESRPQLTVRVSPAWTTDLQLLEASTGLPSVRQIDVGGRRGFVGQGAGGSQYQSLTMVYDEHTIVSLGGDGLSSDQLIAAASSLGPADPTLAPDVAGDPQRCARLGLCG
ncbi:MAG: hypothetical protein M3256_05800 [Actinomycetota bacterium]|nr:hypothetical protein [Actinomycetota bacterium]